MESFTTAHTSMPTHVPGPTFKIGRITDSGGNHTALNNVHVGKFSVYDTALTTEQVVQIIEHINTFILTHSNLNNRMRY